MKRITILVPKGDYILSSVLGTFKIFNAANNYLEQTGKQRLFSVQLVGLETNSELYGGAFSVKPDVLLPQATAGDLVIIPALQSQNLGINADYIPFVTDAYKNGSEIASLCTGAFLLAATGLIDGKHASTHWMAADRFRETFPQVILMPEKIVTDEQGIYTSGGAYSFLNLVLYIVEKYCGREVAIYISKLMEIDIERDNQSQFAIFQGQKEHDDESIRQAQLFMESNISERLTIEQVADKVAISRRNFERRFKKATANTPVEYLQRIRMEAAKRSFEAGKDNVNEVMYAVGYTDNKAFRSVFKKVTGLSPLAYRKKYNRHSLASDQVSYMGL